MADLTGKWNVVVHTYMGDQFSVHEYAVDGDVLTGTITDGGNGNVAPIEDGKVEGTKVSYRFTLKIPIGEMEFKIEGTLQEDGTIKGNSSNAMGSFEFEAAKA